MATFLGLWSETSLKTAFGAADGALPRIVVKGHPRRQDPGLMLKLCRELGSHWSVPAAAI